MKSIQRIFVPGSEWLYLKIYAGENTLERILVRQLPIILRKLNKANLINKWFFIRYADPDTHLRIRFLTEGKASYGTVINVLYLVLNHFLKSNLIWKIQLDTYNRELERYGNSLIEEAETFFYIDSNCMLSIIKKIHICQNENYRWMIALKLIDQTLTDFSFDIQSKYQQMDRLAVSFKEEFGYNQYNSKQLNIKYRENKSIIESVLDNNVLDEDYNKLLPIIKKRSNNLRIMINELFIKINKRSNKITIEYLLTSYIHMMLNRLFKSKNRIYELVLYDFLRRYYASKIARKSSIEL